IGSVFGIAFVGLFHQILPPERLASANSRMVATSGVSAILGPVLGGLVSNHSGPATTFAINAASFAISFSAFALWRPIAPVHRPELASEDERSWLVGIRVYARTPSLGALALLAALHVLATVPLFDLFVYRMKHDLGQSDAGVGVVFSLAGVGGIVGSM